MDLLANNKTTGGGPLSRTWPQLFKKRRRHSPVGESIAGNSSSKSATPPPHKIPIPKTGSSHVAGESSSGAAGTSQADLLASKSNYEWIAEGRHAEMGLHFSTAMATGVMMKRATHRAAEQARRDRMKTAMVDIAEFLLDGEVTFGSGTTCFVVMRNQDDDGEGAVEGVESVKGGKGGEEKDGKRRTTINKSRLIEMALEKLKAQEKEIDLLTERLKHCQCSMETEDTEMS